jgi:hypothetical protein
MRGLQEDDDGQQQQTSYMQFMTCIFWPSNFKCLKIGRGEKELGRYLVGYFGRGEGAGRGGVKTTRGVIKKPINNKNNNNE